MLGNTQLLFKLLMCGQSRLIKMALLVLPLILVFVFFGFFTSHNVMKHFEKYMQQSYFGVFGNLQLASNPEFLTALHQVPELSHLNFSFRITNKMVLLFEGDTRQVLKGVDVIAYEANYLASKLQVIDASASPVTGQGLAEHRLILSSVAYHQLGSSDNKVMRIFNPNTKQTLNIDESLVLDFGFLGSKPIVMMTTKMLQSLTKKPLAYNQVEFNGIDNLDISLIESVADRLLRQGVASDYQLINPKKLSQEASLVFDKVTLFKYGFFFILSLISAAIYLLAINLILNAKHKSLGILECLGVSRLEIWMSLVLFALFAFSLCLFISWLLSRLFGPQILVFLGL